MARLNVYLPDELADRARLANLNISALTQAAIAAELQRRGTDEWLAGVPEYSPAISHDAAMAALEAARDELGGAQ
jgi:post-segregation antitoxin (ccd killing protein)